MEHARKFRNGQFQRELAWPQRITRKYSLTLAHRAWVRMTLPEHNVFSREVMRETRNTLEIARRG